MESYSNTASPRKWCNLPSDALLLISKKLDGKYDRQLSAVCTSWNSFIPKSPSKPHSNFPLEIPCPIIPPPETKESVCCISNRFRFWVVERSVVLISPLKKEAEAPTAWIAKVEESSHKKYALFNPVTGNRILPYCCNRDQNQSDGSPLPRYINLLDFCVTDITKAYTIMWVDMEACYHTHSCSPAELSEYLFIKKVITFHDDMEGIIVLLALRVDGKLASWRSGCEEWKLVDSLYSYNCEFVDIICFDSKFCAVDLKGKLVMIDPLTVKPIKRVKKPYMDRYDYNDDTYPDHCEDDIVATYLVQCEKYLYLVRMLDIYVYVDEEEDHGYYGYPSSYSYIKMLCSVLVEKGWVYDYGFGPKRNCIFFLGNDVIYSLSAKQLGWPRGDFAYHGGLLKDSFCTSKKMNLLVNMCSKESWSYNLKEDYGEGSGIYDFDMGPFTEFAECNRRHCFVGTKIFWPPSGW